MTQHNAHSPPCRTVPVHNTLCLPFQTSTLLIALTPTVQASRHTLPRIPRLKVSIPSNVHTPPLFSTCQKPETYHCNITPSLPRPLLHPRLTKPLVILLNLNLTSHHIRSSLIIMIRTDTATPHGKLKTEKASGCYLYPCHCRRSSLTRSQHQQIQRLHYNQYDDNNQLHKPISSQSQRQQHRTTLKPTDHIFTRANRSRVAPQIYNFPLNEP